MDVFFFPKQLYLFVAVIFCPSYDVLFGCWDVIVFVCLIIACVSVVFCELCFIGCPSNTI